MSGVKGFQDDFRRLHLSVMKKVLLLLPLIALLTACQSKKDICAQWSGGQIDNEEAARLLGLDLRKMPSKTIPLSQYCSYYRN